MHTGSKGVQAAHPVRQPVFDQKIQRPIGHRRLVGESILSKSVQHLVGAKRAVLFQQNFQRPPPHWGQPQSGFARHPLGRVHDPARTELVVVRRKGRGLFLIFHHTGHLR